MRLEQKQKSKNLDLHFGRFMYPTLFVKIDMYVDKLEKVRYIVTFWTISR